VPKEEKKSTTPRWCWWGCLTPIVLIVAYFAFMIISESRSNQKSNATAPERTYVYHAVSSEVKNRTIDCRDMTDIGEAPKSDNPLCLNLYQTSPTEINQKLKDTSYDTVLLYGEKIFFHANREPQADIKNYGQTLYDTAKFTDQVTVPRIMALYGIKDMSYINDNPRNAKILPYDGLYIRLAHGTDTLKFCDQVATGCATGWFSIIVPEKSISEHSFNATLTRENGDTITIESSWPKNCYTDSTFIHEIAHTMSYAGRQYLDGINGKEIPKYFNEYISGLLGRVAPEYICGKGTVTFESIIDGKTGSANLVEFNSIFPPVSLSHHHPEDSCNLAVLALWNKTMAEDWPANFAKFFSQNRVDNQNGIDHGSETAWGQFVLDFAGEGQEYLDSHGCRY